MEDNHNEVPKKNGQNSLENQQCIIERHDNSIGLTEHKLITQNNCSSSLESRYDKNHQKIKEALTVLKKEETLNNNYKYLLETIVDVTKSKSVDLGEDRTGVYERYDNAYESKLKLADDILKHPYGSAKITICLYGPGLLIP